MSKTVERLIKADINAEDFGRAPVAREVFTTTIRPPRPGTIRLWEGDADITVRTSKAHRQAVLAVTEEKRKVERDVLVQRFHQDGYDTPNDTMLKSDAVNRFPIIVSGIRPQAGKVTEMRDGALEGWQRGHNGARNMRWKVHVTATLPASTQHMLVGMDETHHFIAALSEPVNSVREAHEALRPSGVPWNAPRQGEWFFVPVSQALSDKLDRAVAKNPVRVVSRLLEAFSSHRAQQLVQLDNMEYVIGYVLDSRTAHHSPLWLPTWHRAVRNNEVQAPRQAARHRQYWD